MDGEVYLRQIAQLLTELDLEAILIGNAAAALQGAPVTPLGLEFLFCQSPGDVAKLKKLAAILRMVIFTPICPAAEMYRLQRDTDQFQVDFCVHTAGARSFERLRCRATLMSFDGYELLAARPADLAIMKKPLADMPPSKTEIMRAAQIDHLLSLPPERRTNFLRKRIGICRTAL